MTRTEWIEKYGDGLLDAYHNLYILCLEEDGVNDQNTPHWQEWKQFDAALVSLGLLETDEEPEDEEEDLNTSTNWDEWAADQRFDMYRDLALMGYEY